MNQNSRIFIAGIADWWDWPFCGIWRTRATGRC
jgi:hypothetical protein